MAKSKCSKLFITYNELLNLKYVPIIVYICIERAGWWLATLCGLNWKAPCLISDFGFLQNAISRTIFKHLFCIL